MKWDYSQSKSFTVRSELKYGNNLFCGFTRSQNTLNNKFTLPHMGTVWSCHFHCLFPRSLCWCCEEMEAVRAGHAGGCHHSQGLCWGFSEPWNTSLHCSPQQSLGIIVPSTSRPGLVKAFIELPKICGSQAGS